MLNPARSLKFKLRVVSQSVALLSVISVRATEEQRKKIYIYINIWVRLGIT